ncbi:hypothetical protein VPHK367G1_0053 [Vibrio phage K367 g1]
MIFIITPQWISSDGRFAPVGLSSDFSPAKARRITYDNTQLRDKL